MGHVQTRGRGKMSNELKYGLRDRPGCRALDIIHPPLLYSWRNCGIENRSNLLSITAHRSTHCISHTEQGALPRGMFSKRVSNSQVKMQP